MAEPAKTLREQLLQEGAAYKANTTTERALDAAKAACSRSRYEIESTGAVPGAGRTRRGAIQAFCAAIGLLAGTAPAMASEGATVSELAERLELYEARARDAEKLALAKDAELKKKLAELSQVSDGDAPSAPAPAPPKPAPPPAPAPPKPAPPLAAAPSPSPPLPSPKPPPLPSPKPPPPPPPSPVPPPSAPLPPPPKPLPPPPAPKPPPAPPAPPAPAPPPPVAVAPKSAPPPAAVVSYPSSYESYSWTPKGGFPGGWNLLFDGWNSPTAAVLGLGLTAAVVATAGAMSSSGEESYPQQGGYPPQGQQQGGYPGQQGGYPGPQGQQQQGQGSLPLAQQGQQGGYLGQGGQQGQQGQGQQGQGQGQQGGYPPQGGSLGSAANPVTADGWGPSAPIGTPGNPVIGTAIGTPGNPGAVRREAAASVDELLDLMEDYQDDYQQDFQQDYPPRRSYPPQEDVYGEGLYGEALARDPPPSARAMVKAAQATWLARQDGPSSPARGRPQPSRAQPSFRPQQQPPPQTMSRRRGEDLYEEGLYEEDVYGEGLYGEALARDPPPSARAMVKAAQATWLARQDGPSSPARGRPQPSRPGQPQPQPRYTGRPRRKEAPSDAGRSRRPLGDPSERFRDPAALRGDGPSSRQRPQLSVPLPQPQPLVAPQPLAPRGATWPTQRSGGDEGGRGRGRERALDDPPPVGARRAPPTLQAEAVKAAKWLAMQVAPSPRQARARDERRDTPNRRRQRQRVADGAADDR